MPDDKADQRRTLRIIMLVLAGWFLFLALGSFLFGYDPETRAIKLSLNPVRGLIVVTCAAIFLGGWTLLLRRRS